MLTGACLAAWLIAAPSAVEATQGSGEPIGQALGTVVSREQIQEADEQSLALELFRLFFHPLLHEYYRQHQQELQPTPHEIERVTAELTRQHHEAIAPHREDMRARLDEIASRLTQTTLSADERLDLELERDMLSDQLQPPGSQYVEWLVGNWKFQRHLYLNYGGGRILWQQTGFEAFDATYQWLRQQEQAGAFAITDGNLRAAFFAYWTTLEHGAFLIDDQAIIQQEFLTPEWARGILPGAATAP
jgi:hypothetical protein